MEYKKENKTHSTSSVQECQNCKNDFQIEPDDFSFYEKMKVPPPTWCPPCRCIRRMLFVNQRSLYKRNCDNCQKSIISMYHSDTLIPVWCVKCHIGDKWDARDYAQDYDFSRPFFEQFRELKYNTPHRALDQNEKNGTNCEYANYCFGSKNVYLSFDVGASENIRYSRYVLRHNKNCVDSMIIKENDRGYELVQASFNYNCSFLLESDQCIESQFLYDCSNCQNCFMSSNLRNKNYVFRNKQLTREDYQTAIAEIGLNTYSGQLKAKEEFKVLQQNAIHRYAHIKNSVNVVGDFIENSKNIYHCYGLVDAENVKYVFFGINTTRDSQDLLGTGRVEECYEITFAGRGANKLAFAVSCGAGCKNVYYSDSCRGCSDCFGCVGLNKKQYCILNKQYSKEEYSSLIERIIQHMNELPFVDSNGREYAFGEFFPIHISPFAYNETSAFEEEPMTKEEAMSKGYKWRDPEPKSYDITITIDQLPDNIDDIKDSICDEVIECPNKGDTRTQCTSAYRILSEDLSFYRQMNLPLPRLCPNCRYHERLEWKNPFHFYNRECMCSLSNHEHQGSCSNQFETMYAPNRPETIYCDKCYKQEVY